MIPKGLVDTAKRRHLAVWIGAYVATQIAAMMVLFFRGIDLSFTQDSLGAAILISILSVWVLIGLFTYLNRYTKRRYFTLWTVAWLFYGLWLSLHYTELRMPESDLMTMFKQWCVGVAATFMLWGSFRFLGMRMRQTLNGLFLGFLLLWSYIGVYHFDHREDRYWIQVPIFGLIGIASVLTAVCFFRYRRRKPFIGAALLSLGFLLWGTFFGVYPFFQGSIELAATTFFVSAVLQLFIAVSMIILVLEEVKHANQTAFEQIRAHKSEKEALQTRVDSTEERYRSLFDQASEAIVITSAGDFRILEINATAQRMLGISRSEACKHFLTTFCRASHSNLIPPKGGHEWFHWVCHQPSLNLVGKNGTATQVEADAAPVNFDGQAACQFFFREVTDRSRMEQQLRQSEKLSALGQMISGVAHELNNPLAVIKGYLELILAHHDLPAQTRTDLEKVVQESKRAAKLVGNFLAFAREQPAHREMINLNDVVERVTELRKFELRNANVNLTLELASALPQIHADPDQLQQIINNLVTNSVQAMAARPSPHLLKITTVHLNQSVTVCIEDNGPGVPPGLEQKIFEPFFTTKPVGTGTGLGLSIAHSIMAEHHGKIVYQRSSLGGAAFTMELPVITVAPAAQADSRMETKSGLREVSPAQILVLDDEQSIAELLCEMLTLLGHHPTLCLNPLAALDLLKKQEFDLIISDFRMPDMNGQEFHRRIQQQNPSLAKRVIFLTGDVVNEDTHAFLNSTGNAHLAKPFHLAVLEQAVKSALVEFEAATTPPTARYSRP